MTEVRRADGPAVAEAARILQEGGIVVFPTETVYGLGADARDAQAVEQVFAAKGRPADNPVIVHVADTQAARALCAAWPETAEKLARAFWPGPLTIVLPRAAGIPDAATGGLDSIAVRVPRHPVAQALLRACGLPIAAPSANTSGRPSPTTAQHAYADLGERVPLYLDAGPTEVGLESTVIGLLGEVPTMLRPGGVPREAIEAVVGPLGKARAGLARSPGMKYRHYAPTGRVVVAAPEALPELWRAHKDDGTGFIVSAEANLAGEHVRVAGRRDDPPAWGRSLFRLLRELDARPLIVVEAIAEDGLGAAVMNRLRKAAEAQMGGT
ncbi:MAG: L-threonylcarbamoyladenylate synthase [Thermoplasmata archaeon]|jgi:L-threonylcarbamoyladenylate synthase|nr:L-threonylcarbamoyladenylate synthase [Thermoplasmata archaeon]